MNREDITLTTTRKEHLDWCKQRARAELNQEDGITGALASMLSDLSKHPETVTHPAILLGGMLHAGGHLSTAAEMEKFIDGFN